MLDNLRLTAKNSFIYSIGNLSVKLTGLVLIPIYTNPKYLSVEQYGILGILEITSLIIIAVIELSLTQSITRWYWDSEYVNKQKSMFFTVLSTTIGFALLITASLIFNSGKLSVLLFDSRDFSLLIRLMLTGAALEVISSNIQTLLKLQQRATPFVITNIVKLIVNLSVTIVLITRYHLSVEAIFIGQISGNLVFLLLLSKYILSNISLKFEYTILKEMLTYSYPLIFAAVSANFLSAFDRYSLNYLSTLENVGLYNLGFKIANTVKILLVTSVQMAISPLLFKMMNSPESGRFYSKYMTYFGFATMIMVLSLSLFSQEIIQLFTTDIAYSESYKLVPVLTMAIFFSMLKDTSLTGLQIAKKTKVISIVIFSVTALNLLLNVLLIPVFGVYGAAFSTFIAQVIFFIIIYYIAQRKYYIPYELRKVLLIFLTGSVLVLGTYLLADIRLAYRVLIKIALLISFPFILYVFNFYEKIELEKLQGFFTKWRDLKNIGKNIKGFLGK